MSGRCTGWVLKNGPRDRAMRSVLLVIADASNGDGEHAHPGLTNIIEYSLYGRAHVLATLDKLAADGWIEVTGRRSPGKATTYRVRMDRDEVQPLDLETEADEVQRGPIDTGQRSNHAGPEVQSDPAHTSLTSSTVSTTLSLNAPAESSRRVQEAFAVLVERDVEKGRPDKPRAYRAACRRERREDGTLGVLNDLAGAIPEWTAAELADACDGVSETAQPRSDAFCRHCDQTGDHFSEEHWMVVPA